MKQKIDMKESLPELVRRSGLFGATAADAIAVESRAISVRVRQGEVELVERAHQRGVGIRTFHGEASAVSSTSVLTPDSLTQLVKSTSERSALTEPVEHAGLGDPEAYGGDPVDSDIWDLEASGVTVEEAIELATRAEAAALECDERLSNSEGGEMSVVVSKVTLANSHGLVREYSATRYSLSAVPIARVGDEMVRDWWMSASRHREDLNSPEAVGQEAAARTLQKIGAVIPETTEVPVVFSNLTSARLIGAIAGALNGYSLINGSSFLLNSLGEKIAHESVTLVDDGTLNRGLASRPFDGEGLPSKRNVLVENGVVRSYLLDSYSGRKLGMASTHNASRSIEGAPVVGTTNLSLAPGTSSRDEILSTISDGLYVTELFGFGINGTTGDFSQGAGGFWIRDGKLAEPVHEFTVAGNLKKMFNQIEMIGDDPHLESSTRCPTLKIQSMVVAGR